MTRAFFLLRIDVGKLFHVKQFSGRPVEYQVSSTRRSPSASIFWPSLVVHRHVIL